MPHNIRSIFQIVCACSLQFDKTMRSIIRLSAYGYGRGASNFLYSNGQSLNSSTYLQPATWVSISIWKFGHFFLPPKVINFSENSSKVGQHPVICKGFLSYVNGQKSFIIRPSITNPISYIFIEMNKKKTNQ